MGAQHARVIAASPQAALTAIVDADIDRAHLVAARHGSPPVSADLSALERCDGVVVASSTDTHVQLALELIRLGVPVLVEKPLSTSLSEVELVVAEARRRGVPIMCGFVERFNPVIATVRSLLKARPIHMVGLRHSPSPPRAQGGVVHDLLIHDLDLVLRFAQEPEVLRAQGSLWRHPGTGCAEIADCTLELAGDVLATLSASRVSQRKLRMFHLATPDALYEMDLLRGTVTIYRHVGHEITADGSLTYRSETVMDIPFVRHQGEPLAMQLVHFETLIAGEGDAGCEIDSILPPHRLAEQLST
jgi:predicted dehydrogenase